METDAVAADLQRSRERIRQVLLPGALIGRPDDAFPRSAVMRFLFDARKRRLAAAALAMLRLVAGRR